MRVIASKSSERRTEQKCRNEIKRIVFTSSVVAVADLDNPVGDFTEKDWNETALQRVKEKGAAAGVHTIYCASKVYAEKGWSIVPQIHVRRTNHLSSAAWDFYHKHKSEVGWDFAVICPPLVIGVSQDFSLQCPSP